MKWNESDEKKYRCIELVELWLPFMCTPLEKRHQISEEILKLPSFYNRKLSVHQCAALAADSCIMLLKPMVSVTCVDQFMLDHSAFFAYASTLQTQCLARPAEINFFFLPATRKIFFFFFTCNKKLRLKDLLKSWNLQPAWFGVWQFCWVQ